MATNNAQNLLDALGIQELLPEEQEALLVDLSEMIYEGTLVRLLERMDDATKTAFDRLLEADADEEEIQAFLEKNVPGSAQAVEDTVQELRNDILSVTGSGQD
jgi:hypothetical protein